MPKVMASNTHAPLRSCGVTRDYVIQSFRQDKPYDQFLREQLAGDEIAAPAARYLSLRIMSY